MDTFSNTASLPRSSASAWERIKTFAARWWDDIVAVNGALLCGPDMDPAVWPGQEPAKRA